MRNKLKQQRSRMDDVLHVIHRDLSADLRARDLANVAAYSEQHFHRVFKQVIGETVNVYIRRTRLEHAANQLMFDRHSRVIDIAQKCGFGSLSSFTHAFRSAFKTTPAKWREVGRDYSSPPYLTDHDIASGYTRIVSTKIAEPRFVIMDEIYVAYVRHKGYGRGIAKAWQTLQSWALSQDHQFGNLKSNDLKQSGQQLGLHHSNPEWVALEDCHYVACITISQPITRRGGVSSLMIPGGLHAVFELQGQYGDLLPLIGKILSTWLPSSGYALQTTPVIVHYKKNQFLDVNEKFDVRFYLPISTI